MAPPTASRCRRCRTAGWCCGWCCRVGAKLPVTTGWVIEADRAVAVPLAQWSEGGSASQGATPAGASIERDQLTGTKGGAVSWSGVYDAVLNRFAFHDPLADLATVAPQGVDEDCAAYVVAGWWSDPVLDPLDKARSNDSLHELLDRLRWRLLYEWGDASAAQQQSAAQAELRRALGLTTTDRWAETRPPDTHRLRAAAAGAPFVPIDKTFLARQERVAASAFASEAVDRYVAPPWQLRSSLLHGAIYGVPVRGAPSGRPPPRCRGRERGARLARRRPAGRLCRRAAPRPISAARPNG